MLDVFVCLIKFNCILLRFGTYAIKFDLLKIGVSVATTGTKFSCILTRLLSFLSVALFRLQQNMMEMLVFFRIKTMEYNLYVQLTFSSVIFLLSYLPTQSNPTQPNPTQPNPTQHTQVFLKDCFIFS